MIIRYHTEMSQFKKKKIGWNHEVLQELESKNLSKIGILIKFGSFDRLGF